MCKVSNVVVAVGLAVLSACTHHVVVLVPPCSPKLVGQWTVVDKVEQSDCQAPPGAEVPTPVSIDVQVISWTENGKTVSASSTPYGNECALSAEGAVPDSDGSTAYLLRNLFTAPGDTLSGRSTVHVFKTDDFSANGHERAHPLCSADLVTTARR